MYDYQPELDKLHLLSSLAHTVSFGGLYFLQYLHYLLIVYTRVWGFFRVYKTLM
jgi:hypothetical protein